MRLLSLIALLCVLGFSSIVVADEISDITAKAEAGDAEAQYKLGEMSLLNGCSPRDRKQKDQWFRKAFEQYRRAAEEGDAHAQYRLGEMYLYGSVYGVPEDKAKSDEWFHKAIEQYRNAAEQGNADTQYRLGVMYAHGIGVPQDREKSDEWYRKALEHYRKAAEQGDVSARKKLRMMYLEGQDGVTQNDAQSLAWFRKAAEDGDADAQYELAQRFFEYDWYHTAFDQYLKAAEDGDSHAQYKIGEMYLSGSGVSKNEELGLEWLHKADDQGNTEASGFLQLLYVLYSSFDSDVPKRGIDWFRKRAEQGNCDAQEYLGSFYVNGEGIPKNYVQAYRWFYLVEEQQHVLVRVHISRVDISKEMTPEQIAEAERLAEEWLEAHQ